MITEQEINYVLANLDSNPFLGTNQMYDLGKLNSPLGISVLLFCKKRVLYKWTDCHIKLLLEKSFFYNFRLVAFHIDSQILIKKSQCVLNFDKHNKAISWWKFKKKIGKEVCVNYTWKSHYFTSLWKSYYRITPCIHPLNMALILLFWQQTTFSLLKFFFSK